MKTIRQILEDKGITLAEFAEMIDRSPQTLYNTFYRSTINCATLVEWLKALNCDLVIIDRKTHRKYK